MSKVTVVFGGNTGSDPRSSRTWSGSAVYLLEAMARADLLDAAAGLSLPRWRNGVLLATNFNRDRSVWRAQYYFDPSYRQAISKSASRLRITSDVLLQIGHMFTLRHAFPNKKCVSYHDGNLSLKLASGFGLNGVSSHRIEQALRYEEDVAGQMDAIFTMSEYVRQSFISDYHVAPDRVFTIGAGINLHPLPSPTQDKSYSAARILFIGGDFDRKGGPILLRAFSIVRDSLPTAELHIVGPRALTNLPQGVSFHGYLSKEDALQKQALESLFRYCTLFVLPSLYEPFGIAPLEAMLYELPCLVTDGWALRETVTPGFNGDLVPKGSVDALAATLVSMLSSPANLAIMGHNGRERVLNRFTWSAVVNRMSAALPMNSASTTGPVRYALEP